LNIDADGSVKKVQIDSTTTGNTDFDEEVQKTAGRWKFPKMNSSVVATFPTTFFENSTPFKKPTSPKILF
jgi:TonB family protein